MKASTIPANFSDYASIRSFWLKLTTKHSGAIEEYNMTNSGSGRYDYVYGNNNQTAWGNKSVSFIVNEGGVNYTNTSTSYVFVYSDDCIGTNFSNISIGIGNYTNRLQTGTGFLEWFVTPYTEYWGSSFYIIILFVVIGMIYIKNQDVSQPILMGFIGLAALASSILIPESMRNYIMLIMGVALAAIFWKVFKS